MEYTLRERIASILWFLILATGPIGILVQVAIKFDHGNAIAGILGYLFLRLWLTSISLSETARERQFRENKCSECDYRLSYMKQRERI